MEERDRPNRLGDFEIIRQIGRGGMGVVYEARQRSLNRRVALKVLSSALGLTDKAVVRFRREAEAAAKLHHTNIVPIYATGEDRGTYYYAMEFIDGPSLDQVIRQLRGGEATTLGIDSTPSDSQRPADLPVWVSETLAYEKPSSDKEQSATGPVAAHHANCASGMSSGSRYFDTVARMIADVADALEHAHKQGVIHRDIKPSNLLLSPDGRLSVNDFGLARMLEQPGMTISGEFVGSPLYMSPEQITAGRAPLDHRTDIYSLGATLYELLTLQPPYPGRQRDQVIAQILHKEVVPPRRRNRPVPRDLETICLKAVDRDPDRRYQTAGAMAEDLRRFVNRFAISARRAGPVARTVKWTRRHPALAICLVLIALASGIAGILAYLNQVSHERIRKLEEALVREKAFGAAIAGNFAQAKEFVKQAERLHADPGWIRMLNGQIALNQGDYDQAIEDLKQAQELLPDSTAAYALLTEAYGVSGDEDTHIMRTSKLRQREASTVEDFLFKGMALMWGFPEEGLRNLDRAQELNPTSSVVKLLRCRAERLYAMDLADAIHANLAKTDAAAVKRDLPNNPIACAEYVLASIVVANVAMEQKRASDAERALAEADVDRIDPELLKHSDVRLARFQYFLRTAKDGRALEELRQGPLGRKTQETYLAHLGAVELYRRKQNADAIKMCQSGRKPVGELNWFVEAFIRMDEEDRATLLEEYKQGLATRRKSSYLIFDWAVLKVLGDPKRARAAGQDLKELMENVGDYYHTTKINRFLAGDSSPEELQEGLGQSRQYDCMTYFVIGIEELAAGKRAQAKKSFRRCVDTNYFQFYAYHLSLAFLERVDDSNWLKWTNIPK